MPKRATSSDGSAQDASPEPSHKRSKTGTSNGASTTGSRANALKAKEGKQPVDMGTKTDDNGDVYWELSSGGTRRVTVNAFKGKMMVNVREYYEKDGERLPGKKGISLPLDQFAVLVEVLPQIERVLAGKGEMIPRPEYGGDGDGAAVEEGEGDVDGEDGSRARVKSKRKKNFEETSEEGE